MPEHLERESVRNTILTRLSNADFELLRDHLGHTDLPLRKQLESPNKPVERVYFIQRGMASVVANSPGGHPIEVGIIGREGVTGLAVITGAGQSPYETFMQMEGEGWCLLAGDLRRFMKQSETLQATLLLFAHTFLIQATQTAMANGRSKIEERLARWLLMALDRAESDTLPLTHEFLSMMLGVQRSGVTLALLLLEKKGLIQARRRAIRVVDRDALRNLSNGSYGIAEAEHRRLFG